MGTYFAYGSNMNTQQMHERCPNSRPIGPAVLRGYKVVERKYADIDKSPDSTVNGLVWEIAESDLKVLDRYEGYPKCYIRYQVAIELQDSTILNCFVYEMTPRTKTKREGIPYTEAYRLRCREGAIEHSIPSAF
jgi:gamma-glutamylcyclotransferase (GGCT)/AIG2-like uncharacterized protein YtfP